VLDPGMLSRFEEIVREVDNDPGVRVAILTAAGEKAFCAGADINAWAALAPIDMWRRWVRDGHRVFNAFAGLRQPTIAAVNGFAFGGGLELALAADLRIAATHATFASPEVKIGTVPGWAGTMRLPHLIGVARAKQLIFTGARIDATTAERWGLVNEIVPADELLARAWALAEEIAANAPISVQLAKQIIDGAPVTMEALAGALAATTADGREGIAAFREKRAADFTGL
jgi:enoyl-CoA hydratase